MCPPSVSRKVVQVDLLWKLVDGLSFLQTAPMTAAGAAGVTVLHLVCIYVITGWGTNSYSMTPKAEAIKEMKAKYGYITLNRF